MMYSGDEGSLSHYQVLGADPSADYAEIRRKYRAAALALHPDRASAGGPNSPEGAEIVAEFGSLSIGALSVDYRRRIAELGVENPAEFSCPEDSYEPERFLRVQKAWEILRDPESRDRYDRFLFAQRLIQQREEASKVIGEEVYIEEMDASKGDDGQIVEYTCPCRCGDFFIVSAEDLKEVGFTEGLRPAESGQITEQSKVQTDNCVQKGFLVLPCQSCSLHIRMHFALKSA